MTELLIILLIFLILVGVGVAGMFIYLLFFKYKEEITNDPIAINLNSDKSNKRSMGIVKNISKGRKGRFLVTFSPKDVDVEKDNESECKVIVDKIIELPKGTLSKDRDIKILLPRYSEELVDELKEDWFGRSLIEYIEKKNDNNNIIESLREGLERKGVIRVLHGAGELSKEEIRRLRELRDEIDNMLIKDKSKGGVGER